jgi:hypothetical protein
MTRTVRAAGAALAALTLLAAADHGLLWGSTGAPHAAGPPPPLPSGEEIMRQVNARSRGGDSNMRLDMTLHDAKRGDFHKKILLQRKRLASGYRTTYWITAPEHEQGIGLLLSEDATQHGMWMYFPSARQLVRVASRGLSALESDFSCEDLRVAVPLADYEFQTLGRDNAGGVSTYRVEIKPRGERLRAELGFSRSVGWVRDDLWLIVRADYYDEDGKVFKSFRAEDMQQMEGVWTVRRFFMQNWRAQHGTEVRVTAADYSVRLPEELFTSSRFANGPPPPGASPP